MIPVLSSKQMKELDAFTINDFGLPARVLMETAGKGCADFVVSQYEAYLQTPVLVLCGSGNNGGDGAVIARWLSQYGYEVIILLLEGKHLSPETAANLEFCRKLGLPLITIAGETDLDLAREYISDSGFIVDAVYGIGFKGNPPGWIASVFEAVNESAAFVVSVDLPSGLDGDTGYAESAVWADATLCVAAYKLGHLIGLGKAICGTLNLIPIGIPLELIAAQNEVKLFVDQDFSPPPRSCLAHKSNFGKVFVFGGIPGFTGASVLAAEAALRSGAGYVYVLHRMELFGVFANKLKEALSLAIPEDDSTGLPEEKTLLNLMANAAAVLIGPGLGRDDYSLRLLEIVLKGVEVPLVVDADGLNLISENRKLLKYLKHPNVLITPHWGEFERLAGIGFEELQQDCLTQLKQFVLKYKAKVLLKSHFSIYMDHEHTLINISGNDGLATGGSGDVLSGIITAFLAQGHSLAEAAINASWLLGKTAENLAQWRGTPSILPSDIISNLFVLPQPEED